MEIGAAEILYVLLRMGNDWIENHIVLVLFLHGMTAPTSSSSGHSTATGKGGLGSPQVLLVCSS